MSVFELLMYGYFIHLSGSDYIYDKNLDSLPTLFQSMVDETYRVCDETWMCYFKHTLPGLSIPCCAVCAPDKIGDCCPRNISLLELPLSHPKRTCTSISFQPVNSPRLGIYAFADCPEGTDAQLVSKCKNEELTLTANLTDYAPATHMETNSTYKNLYCAMCNNLSASDVEIWQTKLYCKDVPIETIEDIQDAVSDRLCDIIYEPMNFNLNDTDTCELAVSQCNKTGKWGEYDPFLDFACTFFISPIWLIRKFEFYNNVFCAYCNGETDLRKSKCTMSGGVLFDKSSTYSSFLEPNTFMDISQQPTSECAHNEVFIKDTCVKVQCSLLRRFRKNECQRRGTSVGAFSYWFALRLVPKLVLSVTVGTDILQTLISQTLDKLYGSELNRHCFLQTWFGINPSDEDKSNIQLESIELNVECTIHVEHDPEEKYNFITNYQSLQISVERKDYYFDVYMRDPLSEPHAKTNNSELDYMRYVSTKKEDYILNENNSIYLENGETTQYIDMENNKTIMFILVIVGDENFFASHFGTNIITLVTCPVTCLKFQDYPWYQTFTGITFAESQLRLRSTEYFYPDDSKSCIMVCINVLEKLKNSKTSQCALWRCDIIPLLACTLVYLLSSEFIC